MKRTVGLHYSFGAIAALVLLSGCGPKPPQKDAALSTALTVEKGDVEVLVIETGTIDAVKSVEVKAGTAGRLAEILADEGQLVSQGELIATIDKQETSLRVRQNEASYVAAQSQIDRAKIEKAQRLIVARANFEQSIARLRQLEAESKAQPILTQAQIDSARANVRSLKEERERLVTSAHPTQRAQIQASLEEARRNVDNARLDFDRQKDLEAKGFVATRTLQTAELQLQVSTARLQSAEEQAKRQKQQLDAEIVRADEAIRQAEAELKRTETNRYLDQNRLQDLRNARAEVEKQRAALRDPEVIDQQIRQQTASAAQIQTQLEDSQRLLRETAVLSPLTGVITKRYLQVGELAIGLNSLSAGTAIFRIEDRTKMRVKLSINEIDTAKLAVGMEAKVDVDALPSESFKGKISKIAPASKEAGAAGSTGQSADTVVKYEVEVLLDNKSDKLRSGMSARCTIAVQASKNVIVIPSEYLGKDKGETFVNLAPSDPKGKPTRVKVNVGVASGSRIEISSGLKPGDKIVMPDFAGPARKGMMQFGGDGS